MRECVNEGEGVKVGYDNVWWRVGGSCSDVAYFKEKKQGSSDIKIQL